MYNEVIQKIKEYDTIVIARHIGVDPDALCSQLALRDSILLTYPEKKVLAIGTGSSKFLNYGKLDKLEKVENALLIVCDTPDFKRVDSLDFSQGSYSIKIDHHPFMEKFCDLEIIEEDKSSACEIILNMIFQTELQCNDSIAELLYMGIVSDSNRFLFNSCGSHTFFAVSKLLDAYPIDLGKTYEKLYLRPLNEVRLEGYIALNLKITVNQLGYVIITDEVINQLGVDSASAGNMINNFNYIRDVLVWATITEDRKNDQYRVSVRSRGPEINKVAELHHGGGHKYACGVKTKTLEEAMAMMEDLDQLLQEYRS
ncbi:MAG: bifunctional oligoribonuclease/PAP phosphatase NrnA [Bacilli bacterium]|nr:bifunctional oligoribonuclease/PAP phosphatase NrnA [Bacilli bacterium]